MKQTAFYFQHDYNARNDERLLMLRAEHGAEAYGVFWMILESMAESSTGQINRVAIGGLSLGYGVAKDRLEAIIEFCIRVGLFKESQDGAISSPRMTRHLAHRDALKEAGRAGAEKRWSRSQKNRVANAKGKERKEEDTNTRTNVSTVISGSQELSSAKKGPRPSVEKLMKAMHECFGTLDRTEAENRRYAWLLIQRAMKGPPEASEDRAADLCCALITAARKSDWWGDHITCVQDIYRNARKIAASLREQESTKAVFIS